MKKFLVLLIFLSVAAGITWQFLRNVQQPGASAGETLPTLPKAPHEFRFGLLGRPCELPLRALVRLPEMQSLPLKFVVCQSSAERWMLLSSGQIDALVSSSDELASVLPGYRDELKIFPLARNLGNEQVVLSKDPAAPPWVGFLPGGLSQSLAIELKDPQRKLVALDSPESALALLKAGQMQGCSLWNPWLEQSKSLGCEAKGPASKSLELWVSGSGGVEVGRLSQEELVRPVRAWFDLMRQLDDQAALTQQAIAEENELQASLIPTSLKGLQFFSASAVLAQRSNLSEELETQMKDKVNLWSLVGQPVAGSIEKLKVDLSWLDDIDLQASGSPVSPEEPTPEPSASPSPPEDNLEEFSQAGGDSLRSGRLPGPPLEAEPQVLWSTTLPGEPTTPVVASPDGLQLFVGLSTGQLACLERSNGRVMWNFSMEEGVKSAPAVAGPWVQVACDSGQIVSLERQTGQRRWSVQASSDIRGPLAVSGSHLFAATLDGKVLALELASGKQSWQADTSSNITAGLVVSPQRVIACGLDHKVRAFKTSSGEAEWETTLGEACRTTPSLEAGLLTVACADRTICALRDFDGSLAWKQKLGDEVVAAGVCLGRNYYVGCKDNHIYCLDRATGRKVWNYPARERITNDLVGCSNTLYAVSQDMRLYALSADEGKLQFKYKQNSWLQTPWVQDQVVYLPVADATLKALK